MFMCRKKNGNGKQILWVFALAIILGVIAPVWSDVVAVGARFTWNYISEEPRYNYVYDVEGETQGLEQGGNWMIRADYGAPSFCMDISAKYPLEEHGGPGTDGYERYIEPSAYFQKLLELDANILAKVNTIIDIGTLRNGSYHGDPSQDQARRNSNKYRAYTQMLIWDLLIATPGYRNTENKAVSNSRFLNPNTQSDYEQNFKAVILEEFNSVLHKPKFKVEETGEYLDTSGTNAYPLAPDETLTILAENGIGGFALKNAHLEENGIRVEKDPDNVNRFIIKADSSSAYKSARFQLPHALAPDRPQEEKEYYIWVPNAPQWQQQYLITGAKYPHMNLSFQVEVQDFYVEVHKKGAQDKPLADVVFYLEDSQGHKLEELITDASGFAQSKKYPILKDGEEYTLREVKAPLGYLLPAEPSQKFTVLGDRSEEVKKYVFNIDNTLRSFQVSLVKYIQGTEKPLSGAEFALKDPNGNTIEKLTTDQEGKAISGVHELLFPGQTYSIEEIAPPPGFTLSEEYKKTFTPKTEGEETLERFQYTFGNEAILGEVIIQKFDIVSGDRPQGEGVFSSAKYDIVATSFLNPNSTDYKLGDVVDSIETDETGYGKSKPLPLGTYALVEVEAPEGYVLNDHALAFELTEVNKQLVLKPLERNDLSLLEEVNEQIDNLNNLWIAEGANRELEELLTADAFHSNESLRTAERIILGRIELNKVFNSPDDVPGLAKTPEEGIVFGIYNSTGEIVDSLTTNHNGWASSKWLPYGNYILKQESQQEHAYPVEDIAFSVTKDWHMQMFQLQNDEVRARLKVVKKDAHTGNVIPQEGVSFELYKDGELVVQNLFYPKTQKVSQFLTSVDGSVELPESLAPGRYTLKEVKGPDGYVMDPNGTEITFDVNRDAVSSLQELIIVMEVENIPAYGQISIEKFGNVLAGWESEPFSYQSFEITKQERVESNGSDEEISYYDWIDHEVEVYTPKFEEQYLAGAKFMIRARKDIYRGDGELVFRAGEEVEVIETTQDGPVSSKLLPLGEYTVEELEAPLYYAKDKKIHTILLSQENPHQALVQETLQVVNNLQEISLRFKKELDMGTHLSSESIDKTKILFALINQEDINIQGLTLKAGSIVGISGLNQEDYLEFSGVLPSTKYMIRELASAQEYELGEDWNVELMPHNSEDVITKIELDPVFNALKEIELQIVKKDAENNELLLEGAKYRVLRVIEDGTEEVGTYQTDALGRIRIEKMIPGTYYLEEIASPPGYIRDTSQHTIVLDGSQNKIIKTLTNKQSTVEISKVNISGEEIPGAKLEVYDQDRNLIDSWTSEAGKTHIIRGLHLGETYTLRETLAPNGYLLAEEISFTLNTDGTVTKIEMLNELMPVPVVETPSTGESLNVFSLSSFILLAPLCFYKWRKRIV